MKVQPSSLLLLTLALGVFFFPPTTHGFPMIENSVKFALERCKQFLRLATFLKPDALQDAEIRKSKRVCEHIIKIEGDFFDDVKEEDADEAPEALALVKEERGHKRREKKGR